MDDTVITTMEDTIILIERGKVQQAILQDYDNVFVRLVNGGYMKDSSSLIWLWIIEFQSLKCAQAMASGKTGLTQKDSLPIDVAISELGKAIDWTPSQSSCALIFKLCDKSLIVPLKILSLLLHHSPIESTREVFYRYAQQGMAIEMAVLLYVDGAFNEEKSGLCGSEDFKALRQYIGEEIVHLFEEEHKLAKSGEGFAMECRSKKKEKLCILQLLEIFQRTCFYGIGEDPSFESLAHCLRLAGFELNGEFKYILTDQPGSEGKWRRVPLDEYEPLGCKKKLFYLPSFLQPQGLLSAMPVVRKLNNEQSASLAPFVRGKRGYSSAVPPFHRAVLHGDPCTGVKVVKGNAGRVQPTRNLMRWTVNELVMKGIHRIRGV